MTLKSMYTGDMMPLFSLNSPNLTACKKRSAWLGQFCNSIQGGVKWLASISCSLKTSSSIFLGDTLVCKWERLASQGPAAISDAALLRTCFNAKVVVSAEACEHNIFALDWYLVLN